MSIWTDFYYRYRKVFPREELNENEVWVLLEWGFVELRENQFGKGRGNIYYVKPSKNESPKHCFFCYILEQEIKKYTDKVGVYSAFRPDVVVYFPKEKVCFEVETGKAVRSSKKRLAEKFAKVNEEYDEVYILSLDRGLYWKYNKFGKVILHTQIKDTIKQLFE